MEIWKQGQSETIGFDQVSGRLNEKLRKWKFRSESRPRLVDLGFPKFPQASHDKWKLHFDFNLHPATITQTELDISLADLDIHQSRHWM